MDSALESEIANALATSTRSANPLSKLSRDAYAAGIRRFFDALGISTLASARQLSPQAAERGVDQLAEDFSPATARQAVAATNRLYRHWLKQRKVATNPLKDVGRIVGKRDMDWNALQPAERDRLVKALTDPRDYAIVTALLAQGWRVNNLCTLNWGQFSKDGDGDVLVTLKLKRNKTFKQQIKPETLAAARAWIEQTRLPLPVLPNAPFIPADANGTRLRPVDVWRLVCHLTKRHVGRRVTPHGLRATCISEMIERLGIDGARRWAGHESIVTTMRYSRFNTIKAR